MRTNLLTSQDNERELLRIDLYRTLVAEIRKYLRQEDISQTEFAKRIGVSKGYVSRLLNGDGDPKLSSILDLALAINKEPVLAFTDRPLVSPWNQAESLSETTVAEPDSSYNSNKPANKAGLPAKVNWEALRKLPILEEVTRIKQRIDSMRPFSENMERHVVEQMIRIWNYNSNAIEGNSLTYGETLALLLHGLTAKGKPLKDHLDVIGHQDAVDLMLAMVKDNRPLRQTDVRQLHKILLKEDYQQQAITDSGREVYRTIRVGVYKREPNHVLTADNEKFHYAEPNAVPALMELLLDWFNTAERENLLHPLVRSAVLHHEFVAIHPFDDGNGRMTRILTNFALMRAGYPLLVVPFSRRLDYYAALRDADAGDYVSLVNFLGKNLLNSLDLILTTARGEDIGGSKWETSDDDPR